TFNFRMGNQLRCSIVLNLWSIHGVHGRAFAEPTQPPHLADHDRPLRTTRIVEPPDFRHLAKRRETSLETEALSITIAPDETCGFISGSPYNPVTCENPHYQCAWVGEIGILCGPVLEDSDKWDYYLRCYERDQALDNGICNNICKFAHCLTYVYPKGVKDYRCAPTRALQSVSFTVDTERPVQFITATVSLSTATETSHTLTEIDIGPVTTTVLESSHDSNLGAIIGGAVGGFAALLLIASTIFWFVRRSRRDDHPGKAGPSKTHEMSGEPAHSQA
ncbi:hypothetical protein DER44DRAFT_680270, partial [Fusarium oxysporum]